MAAQAIEGYNLGLLALCLWREARGESPEARRAVLHVILNRMRAGRKSAADVVLKPRHFSSFNPDDANAAKYPRPGDPEWPAFLECCAIVDSPGADPTGGANHYESCPDNAEPKWADDRRRTARIGPFEFYRL